jgi:hypothetical protein
MQNNRDLFIVVSAALISKAANPFLKGVSGLFATFETIAP